MKGTLTKTQVQNTAKYLYDLSKFVAVGGIITPMLNKESFSSISIPVLLVATFLYMLALVCDGAADRMGEHT